MTIEEIRDELVKWVKDHRATCGDPHCHEPANVIGFLAHCAGLRVKDVDRFRTDLQIYEESCVQCPHVLRN